MRSRAALIKDLVSQEAAHLSEIAEVFGVKWGVLIPIRDSKETSVFVLGSENCAVRRSKGPGAFLEWRRFSSVVVLAPRHRHALPFQEITPAFVSFETLLGIIAILRVGAGS